MAKKTFRNEATSRDDGFADAIRTCNAAQAGDAERVKMLLKKNPDLATSKNHSQHGRRPIHYAAREGHADVVEILLEAGASPAAGIWPNREASQPLTLARERGHNGVVALMEAWLNTQHGTTSRGVEFCDAARMREFEKVRFMLDREPAIINESDTAGNTALHYAVSHLQFDPVTDLLTAGADVTIRNAENELPIHRALFRGNDPGRDKPAYRKMAELLLEHGADYDIWVASALGDRDGVRKMLEADPGLANYRCGRVNNKNASTYPLAMAAREGHLEVVDLLLDSGADVDTKCERNGTVVHIAGALIYALERKHFDVAERLMDRGARTDAPPNDSELGVADEALLSGNQVLADRVYVNGGRPMMWTYVKARQYCVIGELLDRATAVREAGYLPQDRSEGVVRQTLRWGLSFGDANVVKMCLRCEPDFDADYWFESLRWGLQSGAGETVRMILDYGVDVNVRGPENSTLLHWIGGSYREREDVWNNSEAVMIELAEVLLDYKADLNVQDDELCSTPLGWHVRAGHKDVVAFLLEHGASANIPDTPAWAAPLSWAEKRGHREIAEMLRQAGARSQDQERLGDS